MKREDFTVLNNHLFKLEKNVIRIQTLQEKGCTVDRLSNDIYPELTSMGYFLEKGQGGKSEKEDDELGEIIERRKNLMAKDGSVANEVKSKTQGLVLVSKGTIPDFFYNITSRYRGMWKLFEVITTLFGCGIIGFTLLIITYLCSFGRISFFQFLEGGISGVNSLGFVAGIILGLCVHEFAHGIILANNGIKIKRVGVAVGSIVGGVIEADETTFFQAGQKVHFRFNASGIGTNALLALILGLVGFLTSSDLLILTALGNLFFGFINSLPIIPLDGGWVYEDLINMYVPSRELKAIFLSGRFVLFIFWVILFTFSALFYYS